MEDLLELSPALLPHSLIGFDTINSLPQSGELIQTSASSPLVLIRQNSLSVEPIYKNGIQKKVHVVVKNHPFAIQVGLGATHFEGTRLDFNRFPLEARLVYDCDTFKEVAFVKLKPLEFKCHVNERGDQATVELRPKVLTSQLEDMLFRVKLVAVDSITKQQVPNLYVLSEPIKVVSKPEQVKKKKAAAPKVKKPAEEKESKKQIPDLIGQYLDRIENTCAQQQNLLSLLYETASKNIEPSCSLERIEVPTVKKQKTEVEMSPFEKAFMTFVDAYNCLEPEEKVRKVRKVMKNVSQREAESVSEMLESFQTAASDPIVPECGKDSKMSSHGTGCECTHCPHREELKKIEEFYSGFLVAPEGVIN